MNPRVFVSYSHDSPEHRHWVLELASALRSGGIDVILDHWDLRYGQDIASFMERSLATAHRVIVVCSEEYVRKANAGFGGAGYEKSVISSELMSDQDTLKFLPIVLSNPSSEKLPRCLSSRLYLDFSDASQYALNLQLLLRELHGLAPSNRPALGASPFEFEADFNPDTRRNQTAEAPSREKLQLFGISPTFLRGAQIGGCTIKDYVGSGGFGFVFRAKHAALGHDVAVKVSYPISSDSRVGQVWSFGFRAVEQKLLIHPNIARLYAAGTSNVGGSTRLFTVSEFIEGRSLRCLIGPFVDERHATKVTVIFKRLCEAVAYAHSTIGREEFVWNPSKGGLVHGDIKPGNVLLRPDFDPVLVDFEQLNFVWVNFGSHAEGSAEEQDGYHWVTAGGDANPFGTPGYMAPEIINGGELSVSSDIYALGMTLYELCTGEKLPVIRALNMHGGRLSHHQLEILLTIGGPFVPNWVADVLELALVNKPQTRANSVATLLAKIPTC